MKKKKSKKVIKEKYDYSIKVIVGATGSGKTSTAQYLTLEALNRNEAVWSNMPIAGAYKTSIHEIGHYAFVSKDKYGNLRHGGLLIIDEAGMQVNGRNWREIPDSFLDFLKLHRHYKMDVYFFSQGDNIDNTIRQLAKRWYKLVKPFVPVLRRMYTIAIPVTPSLQIENGQWVIKYHVNKIPFSNKYLPIYKTWHLFNSYDVPDLPIKEYSTWGEVHEKPNKFLLFIKKYRRVLGIKWYRFCNKKLDKKIDDIFRGDKND